MLIRWYRKFLCWINGHQVPICTGRLRDHTGDWKTMACVWCDQQWLEPIPNNRFTITPNPKDVP